MPTKFKSPSLYIQVAKLYHTFFSSIFFSPYLQPFKDTHPEHLSKLKIARANSQSQLMQDIFVLCELNFKENGYFVEFGATNGVELSNSHLLEKEFGWKGILAEPAKVWHKDLRENRTSFIEEKCVWTNSSSILEFSEVSSPELSTILSYQNNGDWASSQREQSTTYQVETISLVDLLDKYQAPKIIDYLSIDTEGSEFEILSNFDFSKYRFQAITCEHNYTPERERIYQLLTKNGYIRKYPFLSKWDDWYVWGGE
jgi:FkbM family methyltransferase